MKITATMSEKIIRPKDIDIFFKKFCQERGIKAGILHIEMLTAFAEYASQFREGQSGLPDDKETQKWFDENIGVNNECSASSAVYKFRLFLRSRFPSTIPSDGWIVNKRPKIICYCGSLRKAMDAFKKAEYDSVLKGEIALLPCCMFVDIEREYGANSQYKSIADELHKRKIDLCDEVFILNVDWYIGASTRSEIEYAKKIGKPISYLLPLQDPPQSKQ